MSVHGKAQAALEGIKDFVARISGMGPDGKKGTYFVLLVITFNDQVQVQFGPDICGLCETDNLVFGKAKWGTNIGLALSKAYEVLLQWMPRMEEHGERDEFPLPRVILFSDGQNQCDSPDPLAEAEKIKALNIDDEPVVIATAGVSVGDTDWPDEELLKSIASSRECYFHIDSAKELKRFLAVVGSVTHSTVREMEREKSRFERRSGRPRLEH
jgi:hypothetical protein